MKKLFSRKKRNEPDTSANNSSLYTGSNQPGLRTSLYDTTTASVLPQTGDYPIGGNNSPNVLKKKPQSRRSSIRSWRSTTSFQQPATYNRSPTPDLYGTPLSSPQNGPEAYAPQPTATGQRRLSRSQLPQDFANLNLDSDAPIVTTTTTTTTSGPNTNVNASKRRSMGPGAPLQGHVEPSPIVASIRSVNPAEGQDVRDSPKRYSTQNNEMPNQNASSDGVRKASISRKRVGSGSSSRAVQDASAGISPSHAKHNAWSAERTTASVTARPDSSRGPPTNGPALDAQTVIDKAQTNTEDVSVSENYAPAVVHETVHQDVHHVREEIIRREIHTHDIYHRILPVIDVEVLPARHFLPVEGGGLAEVSAEDVPGRGNNWVLAETISQIPSDQPAPRGPIQFTAREFRGMEGDDKRYVTEEGYERTEQTWVHPPELQTGARDTGQSWPMVFGEEEAPRAGEYGYKSPKSERKRRSKGAGAEV